MKKILFFLFITSFCACKTQDDLKPDLAKLSVGTHRTLFQGDGLYDALGYGIDATLDPLDPNSVSRSPIINTNQFADAFTVNELPSYLSKDFVSKGDFHFYSGLTTLDYSTSLTRVKGFDANANVGVSGSEIGTASGKKTEGVLFTGAFKKSTNDMTTNASSSRFSYAGAEVYQRIRRLAFTGSTTMNMLMNYLTPAFLSDVNNLSADALVARYGTHVLLDISIGGVLKFDYSAVNSSQAVTTSKTEDIKASLGVTVKKIVGVDIGYNATTTQINTIKSSSQNILNSMRIFGGANSGLSVSIDINGNPSQTINFGTWTSSILPTNATITDIGKAVYLYDFIVDPAKKAAVKTAVENHINAAQLSVAVDPIYQFYSSVSGGDHFSSGNINATDGFYGWQNYGVDFRAFLGYVPGTVPVYLFYNGVTGDHYSSTNVNATTGIANWVPYGITYYAYKTQIPGTIPIYLYWNAGGSDHFVTSNPNIANQYPGWQNYGVVFYAFPN